MSKNLFHHTIVGGRPVKSNSIYNKLPVGLEAIIVKASVDKELYLKLVQNKEEFLKQPDLPLSDIEKEMLKSISETQLQELIANCTPPKEYVDIIKTASIAALIAFVTNLGVPSLLYAFNKYPDNIQMIAQSNIFYDNFNLSDKDRITRGISPDLIEDEEDNKVEGIRPSLPQNFNKPPHKPSENLYNEASDTNTQISLDLLKNTIIRTEVKGLTLSEAIKSLELETSIPIAINALDTININEKTIVNTSVSGLNLFDAIFEIFAQIFPNDNYSIDLQPLESKILVTISKKSNK